MITKLINFRFSVVLLVCLSGSLTAQNVKIRLHNCTLDSKTLEQIQYTLNFQLTFFEELFKQPVDSAFNARIFENEKEFATYSKMNSNFNPVKDHTIAYFDIKSKEMYLHKEVDDFATVFAHELSHAILYSYNLQTDPWLEEGLAELLEDIKPMDSSYHTGEARSKKIKSVQFQFGEGASIRDAIFSADFGRKSDYYQNYLLSFATVMYLVNARRDIFPGIARSQHSNSYYALMTNYPGGIDLLEIDVKSFFLNFKPSEGN